MFQAGLEGKLKVCHTLMPRGLSAANLYHRTLLCSTLTLELQAASKLEHAG